MCNVKPISTREEADGFVDRWVETIRPDVDVSDLWEHMRAMHSYEPEYGGMLFASALIKLAKCDLG